MAAAAAPWILRGLLGARGSSGLMNLLKPPYRNPFRGPTSTRTGTKYPKGGRRSRTTGVPLGGKPIIKHDPGGIFYRNPMKTMYGGLAAGTGAAGLAYGLLSGDDKPDDKDTGPSATDLMREAREQAESDALAEKQPSMSAGHRTAYLKKRDKRLKKGMKQLLNQYMILCAVAPDECDNFLKSGMKMMEADQEFNDDLYNQNIYDTIFQPGNMPGSGREAYQMLIQSGLDSKEAMKVAGDYHDLTPEYKEYNYMTKQRMEMRDVVALANAGDRSGAIALLIQGWQSGSFKTMPDHLKMGQATEEEWIKEATKAIDLMTTGSVGGEVEDPLIRGIVG
mgnify:CR=1 FL=1